METETVPAVEKTEKPDAIDECLTRAAEAIQEARRWKAAGDAALTERFCQRAKHELTDAAKLVKK